MSSTVPTTAPLLSGTMNWTAVRQRLLGSDLTDAYKAATELRENIEIVHSTEFPLMLSALLPAFSSILGQRTRPTPDTSSVENKLRHTVLDIIAKMPSNEILRPHAPHLVAVAIDILSRDYEENALLASRIIFDLHKVYRSLPQDYVQPYIDFVVNAYRSLPVAIQQCFTVQMMASSTATTETTTTGEKGKAAGEGQSVAAPPATTAAPTTTTTTTTTQTTESSEPAASKTTGEKASTEAASISTEGTTMLRSSPSSATLSLTAPPRSRVPLRSNMSFRVLTECPLMVMLMFQLYPKYVNKNIPVLIGVMLEGLALRAPTLTALGLNPKKLEAAPKRFYFQRTRELVAAQAKTLSFMTYLLRTFSSELKAYEDRLANNVVALMTICPREAVSTRKELLAATRHLLNSEFRRGFFRHVDALLDERVLMGSNHRGGSDLSLLRPLGYTTLSDLVQHVKGSLSMTQMSRVVGIFSRVLHDNVGELPMSTQYIAIRTLLSVVDIVFHNKDPDPQIGRDMLVRILSTMRQKLGALAEPFAVVGSTLKSSKCPTDREALRDIQSMIRAIIVGHKTVLYYVHNYKTQRENREKRPMIPVGSNEEVSSALLRLTITEVGIVNDYITTAFRALRILRPAEDEKAPARGEKSLAEQHRDALTYFASAFTAMDGYNLRRTLGQHMDMMFDAIVDDPTVMVIPRHLLASNKTTSFEFCSILLDYLVDHMWLMSFPRPKDVIFVNPPPTFSADKTKDHLRDQVHRVSQQPAEDNSQLERKSTTCLQLFERILKSLTSFPDNESLVRSKLKKIVSFSLKASLENTAGWSDSYCMLLRYIFRSITAGKFEESYKELLPLIPAVLNGLYRIIVVSGDSPAVLHTSIELCLTIPARLSALLPHMNLLLRIIIPALDSSSGDLVNLGLRTLEFWIDNLNPLFLYPEVSKEKNVFSRLMQSLSRHLRPAPYPYGLLTLRLLGKLGGKNREFLREPVEVVRPSDTKRVSVDIVCRWNEVMNTSEEKHEDEVISFPLHRCLALVKLLSSVEGTKVSQKQKVDPESDKVPRLEHSSAFWDCAFSEIDFDSYKERVAQETKCHQAIACFKMAQYVLNGEIRNESMSSDHSMAKDEKIGLGITILLHCCLLKDAKDESLLFLKDCAPSLPVECFCSALCDFMTSTTAQSVKVVREALTIILNVSQSDREDDASDVCVWTLCECLAQSPLSSHVLFHEAILFIVGEISDERKRKHEYLLVNAASVSMKSIPRELSRSCVDSCLFSIKLCSLLYNSSVLDHDSDFVWDCWPVSDLKSRKERSPAEEKKDLKERVAVRPNDETFKVILEDLVSTQHISRFAARFILLHFAFAPFSKDENKEFITDRFSLVKKVFFSRSLRLMPLVQQVGIVEGLALFLHVTPDSFLLGDQHLLTSLSELLKMLSVGDGEMTDKNLSGSVVDKDGFVLGTEPNHAGSSRNGSMSHSSALFFRRECVAKVNGQQIVIPEEMPVGVQLRVSAICLLHCVVRGHSDVFFDTDASLPIGNIRPHVVSLLFRSLISSPYRAVDAAHFALSDVLHLSLAVKNADGVEKSQSRLPKELLQTCIRPVLLHLRDYTRLSLPLLRGLSRLLSLLSSWFNKTLGEKLLDHLQKWTDPGRIISHKIWRQGDEPSVAAAIVEIFSSLPHASHFVEPLVKTCIKLEATITAFKTRFVSSPFRAPLARYLDKHPKYAVSFFFQRLKTPMYSELFQYLVALPDCEALRSYLNDKHCSVMILNVCFERPLAIIRSEKSASTGSTPPLLLHGVPPSLTDTENPGTPGVRSMIVESLEIQLQGLRLVDTLMAHNPSYFKDHNDIVRALRWLWRSKGRVLRLQHEDLVFPRFHKEFTLLASFFLSYAKSFPNEDLDILFELSRVFLQTSSCDFSFARRFLSDTIPTILDSSQKKQVVDRFFALVAGDSTEDIKILSIQFLIFPILESEVGPKHHSTGEDKTSANGSLITAEMMKKFATEVLYHKGSPVSCGERLKVEILRLLNLFVQSFPKLVEPFRKEMVRFCWGLLKCEDMSCKGWAYLVVACFIDAFDTPSKIVMQVYVALLRSHQQEGKELFRQALDLVVPALRRRLPEGDFRKMVEQTSQLLLEEGNSSPQLAHISSTIVRNPETFYGDRARFAGYMVNSINRLGMQQGCPLENRVLSVDIVGRLLDWEDREEEMSSCALTDEQIDTLANFLIRLKIFLSEVVDGKHQKVESPRNYADVEVAATEQLKRILSSRNVKIRVLPFEKVLASHPTPNVLLSLVDILVICSGNECRDFITSNPLIVKDIILMAFGKAREDKRLRMKLTCFVERTVEIRAVAFNVLNALEKIVVEITNDQKKKSAGRGSLDPHGSSRSRDRPQSGLEESGEKFAAVFLALNNIASLCKGRGHYLKTVYNSLIDLALALSKHHLATAAAKLRHGSQITPWATSPGTKCHTPTVGILEELSRIEAWNTSRGGQLKLRLQRDSSTASDLDGVNKTLIKTLSIIQDSDSPYTFTSSRRSFFQILNSLLDGSDCVQVLMICTRIVGRLLLSERNDCPLTRKERSNFMRRLASLGYCSLQSDIEAQPLCDITNELIARMIASKDLRDNPETSKIILSSTLQATPRSREEALKTVHANEEISLESCWRLVYANLEGLGTRFWPTVLVDSFLLAMSKETEEIFDQVRSLVQADPLSCLELLQTLLPSAWRRLPHDSARTKLASGLEFLLARPYHAQFIGNRNTLGDERCSNAVRGILNAMLLLRPMPSLDLKLLLSLAESYNCWYEVIAFLEAQFDTVGSSPLGRLTLSAMRQCFRGLEEENIWMALSSSSCNIPQSSRVLSEDIYGMISEATEGYSELVEMVEANQVDPTDFEMTLWEDRWVDIQKELCQLDAVSEYADISGTPRLQLECAWKRQDWTKVRSLFSSSSLLPAVESGDPMVKMSETLLAVADGKLAEVENLHAQTAQLCLYKWQLLPKLATGVVSHSSLLRFFHRLVEIRESGHIMVETNNHSNGRTIPDLRNLLNAWRHRLPNSWERLSAWDDIFTWRAHMFSAITSNFNWLEPDVLSTLHDQPWTVIQLAKTARKQNLRDVSALLLDKIQGINDMSVPDAYLKIKEQIMSYYNPKNEVDRQRGLNMINSTNLSYFDDSQKSDLFRLKGKFLSSLGTRSKANQAYCHAVQISESYARAWTCWGQLCSSLGAVTEKQSEQEKVDGDQTSPDAKSKSSRVSQYLAQAMGCYLEAINIDPHEQARIHIPKCLWMVTKDAPTGGTLVQTLEDRGPTVPAWVWLPWIPQLLTSFYRIEARATKIIFGQLVRAYPQAVYYPLRSFYLERRDVERARTQSSSSSSPQHKGSVAIAEVMMSLLRRSHTSLWSSLESVLEELIVKFRPSYEEELLSTLLALYDKLTAQMGSLEKPQDEDVLGPVRKTLNRICVKFFRPTDSKQDDERSAKTAEFKSMYREKFEKEFAVSADGADEDKLAPLSLEDLMESLKNWKSILEKQILSMPMAVSLAETSQPLSMFSVSDIPDLWPGSCDPNYSGLRKEREKFAERDTAAPQSSTSSSAAAARRAASLAAVSVSAAASRDGNGGEFGGGSSLMEIPGQYAPNTSRWADTRPSPELHTKLLKFLPKVEILRRSDQLVRRIGMIGSDGKVYRFLLQFALPYWTRTDERTAQTYFILDKMIRKDFRCMRAQLSVQPNTVIPVAQRLRLTLEDPGRQSLDDVYRSHCAEREIGVTDLSDRFTEELNKLSTENKKIQDEKERSSAEKEGRMKLLRRISVSKGAEPDILTSFVRSVLKDPELVFNFRRTFSQQWAINCLLQYVFSISERSPSRVAFIERDGRVLSPDFKISYGSQGLIDTPSMPFRLTPNVVNLIGCTLLEAGFTQTMARVAGAVDINKGEMDPILRLLSRDDLVAFYTKSVAKSDSQTREMEKQLVDRVSKNVATLHARVAECIPKSPGNDKKSGIPVDQKVRDLIAKARSVEELCMMAPSYQGWI